MIGKGFKVGQAWQNTKGTNMNVVTVENGETMLRVGLNPGRGRKVYMAVSAPESWQFKHKCAATFARLYA